MAVHEPRRGCEWVHSVLARFPGSTLLAVQCGPSRGLEGVLSAFPAVFLLDVKEFPPSPPLLFSLVVMLLPFPPPSPCVLH